MAIQLIPRKQVEIPNWQTLLFYLSVGFFVLSLASFFIVSGSARKTAAEAERLNAELSRGETVEESALQKDVVGSQRRILAFISLLGQQKPVSAVFSLTEKLVHPQVIFSKFNFVAQDSKIWLSGKADNFQVLGEQNLLFKKEPAVKQAYLLGAGIGKEGGIEFSFEIFLDPAFFQTAVTAGTPSGILSIPLTINQ
jgi:hypothetical protein